MHADEVTACFCLSRSMGFKVCYYCVIGNQRGHPKRLSLFMFSIDSEADLVNGGDTLRHTAAGQVCVALCVCGGHQTDNRVTTWEENNTINRCSWNISFLKDHEPY